MASGLRQWLHDVSPYLLLLIAISTLGPLQFGYHLAELNAPEDVISCRKKAVSSSLTSTLYNLATTKGKSTSSSELSDCIPMDKAAFAVVSSTFFIGGLVGALASGPFSSSKGRLLAMRSTSLLYVLGSIIETLATSVPVITFGRFVSGIPAGAATVIVPLYISEVAPPKERGFFGVMTQVSINVGILFTQTLGYFLSYGSAWRWILGTGVIVAAAHFFGLFIVPESPAWLAANKSVGTAKRTLQRIRGKNYSIQEEVAAWGTDASITAEEQGLLDGTAEEAGLLARSDSNAGKGNSSHMGFFQVLRDPVTRPAIIAVVGILCVQQLCGINSIIMYSVSLLNDLLPISSALLTVLISVVNLFMTIACSPLPDKLGRKACLLLSIIGQGISSLFLAASIISGVKILSAISVLLFVAFFAVGLGPVPFMMASELVGQEAVGATQSWGLAANYVATFLVAQFFPLVDQALNRRFGGQGWVYFLFAALAALSALFVSWRLPETKGKKDADEVWGRTRRLD